MALHRCKFLVKTVALNAAVLAMAVSNALAGTVVVKPGAQDTFAPEFGVTIARSGNYTVAASIQETVVIPGEPVWTGSNIGSQGAVYLFNDTNPAPERVYQFPGNNHFFKKIGAKVAISDKWVAFVAAEHDSRFPNPSAVYIVGKTNNQWAQCPTVNAVVDCTSLVSDNGASPALPITRIPFSQRLDLGEFSIAISDDYLVMGDYKNSKLNIYRYDAALNHWVEELSHTDLPERRLGTAVAIDGDKVAVSAPFYVQNSSEPGVEQGTVRVYKRNADGTWHITAGAYGWFTEGNFGHALDMHSGNLVVSSDQLDSERHLTFYRVDSTGSLSAPYSIVIPTPSDRVAVHGDTAVVTTRTVEKSIAVYQRNTSDNSWSEVSALDGNLYASGNPSGFGYPGGDEIDLAGDNLVLGWRAYKNLVGGFIHEKVSLIDYCKSPLNLVANCSFDNASGNGWQFLTHQGASASVSYSGNQLTASIANPGSQHWHIQARRPVNLPTASAYQLEFRAKASSYRDLTVNIGHNGNTDNNWQSYGQTVFTPGPEWTRYTYEFYGVPADANALLDFNLGNAGTASITIDGVKLTPIDS